MILDKLRAKYPSHADIIQYQPISNCRHCHGTGERKTHSKSIPLTVCMCVCVDHKVAEDAQDALSQIASQMLAELREEQKRSVVDLIIGDGRQRCIQCGRERVLQNMKHTRLYGYLCICGSDEWVEDK